MELTLVRVTADGGETPVRITKERTVIGRDTSCQIRVPAVDVSRKHCEIAVTAEEVVVADMGSRNGTLVNGEKVERATVSAGDVVTVGPLVFVVQIDGEPGDIDAAGAHKLGTAEAKAPRPKTSAAAQKVAPEHPTSTGGSLMDDIAPGADLEDSSVVDFEFDFDDDADDDQPPL